MGLFDFFKPKPQSQETSSLFTSEGLIVRDAFRMYILDSFYDLKHFLANTPKEALRPSVDEMLAYIDEALINISSGKCVSYRRRSAYSLYPGQTLTPENKVLMDLFDKLSFGNYDKTNNRALSQVEDEQTKQKIMLYSIARLLTEKDSETMNDNKKLAAAFKEFYSKII